MFTPTPHKYLVIRRCDIVPMPLIGYYTDKLDFILVSQFIDANHVYWVTKASVQMDLNPHLMHQRLDFPHASYQITRSQHKPIGA